VGEPPLLQPDERAEEAREVLVRLVVPEEEDVGRVEGVRAADPLDRERVDRREEARLDPVRDGADLRRAGGGEARRGRAGPPPRP
jgi:hypothetical protein